MYKKIVLWALVILHISLIFSFSLQSAKKSSGISRGFTDKIKSTEQFQEEIKNKKNDDGSYKFESEHTVKKLAERHYVKFEGLIRKLAHISLFFILGLLISILIRAYGMSWLFCALMSLVFAAAVGFFDETIQLFSVGRAGSLKDVLIDISGAVIASIFFYAGGELYEKIKEKRIKMDI